MIGFDHGALFRSLQTAISHYTGDDEKMAQEIGKAIGASVSIACPTTSDAVRFADDIAEHAKKMIFSMTGDDDE